MSWLLLHKTHASTNTGKHMHTFTNVIMAVKLSVYYIDCNWLHRQWWTTHWLEFNNLLINNIEEKLFWNWKAYDKIASSNHIKSIIGFKPLHVYNFFFRFIIQLELKSVWNFFFATNHFYLRFFFNSYVRSFIHFLFPIQVMFVNDLRFLVGLAAVSQFLLLFSQVSGILRECI